MAIVVFADGECAVVTLPQWLFELANVEARATWEDPAWRRQRAEELKQVIVEGYQPDLTLRHYLNLR